MSPRRLAAVLAAALAGTLLALAFFLHHQHVSVELSGGPAMPPLPAPPLPNVPAASAAGGAPIGAGPGYTNEMQAANLARQKTSEGIAGVTPPPYSEADRQALLQQVAQARTPDEAVSALRQLSLMNQAARARVGRKGPVELNGSTPKLLAAPGGAADEKGSPLPTADWFAAGKAAPGKNRIISAAADWAALWKQLFPGRAVPAVDFSKDEVAVVVAGPKPSGDGLEIVSAGEEDGSFVIRYRQTRSLSDAAFPQEAPRWLCAMKKIPRQALAARFVESR
ncbi:MAG TPA: hypothetical protein VNH15_02800 [Elusimicrobiota bacterium]|nr:hypothetical protein [Elusimicrobiota bacterium]